MIIPRRLRRTLPLISLAILLPLAAAAEEGVLEFAAPRYLSTALGPTEVELLVLPPSGVRVEEVVLSADGKTIATFSGPPWKTMWDAGDGARGHQLEAVAQLSDGSRIRGMTRTSPLRINQVEEVGLVSLYPMVRDRRGNYVSDLTREDFRILENGVSQSISRFTTEQKPLQIGIVLDTSLTMSRGGKLVSAQRAALGFLDVLRPGDEAMLVTFSDEVRVAQELTDDRESLAVAIEATEAKGGTALYDAIWRTSNQLRNFDGRRVLVLLSDGKDEAADGFGPGSLHTLDESLDQALRSEVMVFGIGLGHNLDRDFARDWSRPLGQPGPDAPSLKAILKRVAETTGGRLLISPGARRLRRAFDEVAEDLRNQYSIAYASSDPNRDGGWRKIEVLTPGRDLRVTCRQGYFAEPPGESELDPAQTR